MIGGSSPGTLQAFMVTNGYADGFDHDKDDYASLVSGRFFDPNHISDHEQGLIIQPPSRPVGRRILDPAKREKLIAGYQAYRSGADELPDMTDAFPEDNKARSKYYLQVSQELNAREILTQACTQCHADHLDQRISRAKFNAQHLGDLSVEELSLAQARINLPIGHLRVMPPSRYRNLLEDQRELVTEYLQLLIDAKR